MTPTDDRQSAESLFESGKRFLIAGSDRSTDADLAVRLFERSARLGYAPAQRILGVCHLEGKVAPRDLELARYWLTAASDQNDPSAAYNLALMYAQGRGVEKNWSEAHRLLRRPGVKDLPEALELRRRLKGELIKLHPELASALDAEERILRLSLTSLQRRLIQPFLSDFRNDDDSDEFEAWLTLNLGRSDVAATGSILGRCLRRYYGRMLAVHPSGKKGVPSPSAPTA
jgi:hypothetical protein